MTSTHCASALYDPALWLYVVFHFSCCCANADCMDRCLILFTGGNGSEGNTWLNFSFKCIYRLKKIKNLRVYHRIIKFISLNLGFLNYTVTRHRMQPMCFHNSHVHIYWLYNFKVWHYRYYNISLKNTLEGMFLQSLWTSQYYWGGSIFAGFFKLLDTQSFEIRLFESFIPRVEAWCICGLSKKQGELLSELMSSISPSLQGK